MSIHVPDRVRPATPPLLVDLPRAQELLGGISRQTIHRLAERGELPRVKIGRSLRFRYDDIVALIEAGLR